MTLQRAKQKKPQSNIVEQRLNLFVGSWLKNEIATEANENNFKLH